MPTDKRERQKAARQARLEAERAAAKKAAGRRRMIISVVIAALLFAVILLIATVGGNKKKTPAASATTTTSAATSTSAPAPITPPTCTTGGEAGDMTKKPTVTVPSTPPPAILTCTDLKVGTGAEAKSGTHLTVQYVGVAYSTKKQFDASWDRNQPFEFDLPGQVIDGWNQGIAGMKVGGRRELIIPPSLGYGEQGQPPSIGPNETLVFVVDLLKVA